MKRTYYPHEEKKERGPQSYSEKKPGSLFSYFEGKGGIQRGYRGAAFGSTRREEGGEKKRSEKKKISTVGQRTVSLQLLWKSFSYASKGKGKRVDKVSLSNPEKTLAQPRRNLCV